MKLQRVARYLPQGVVTNLIMTITNSWPTTKRYQHHGVGECCVCCLPRMDHIFHYFMCPGMKAAFREIGLAFQFPNGRMDTIRTFCLMFPMELIDVIKVMIINDVFLKAFNCLRTGSAVDRVSRTMKARLRFWSSNHGKCYGSFIRQWLGNPDLIVPVKSTK